MNQINLGIIGLDTSHVDAFTELFNDPKPNDDVGGCSIVAAYPRGSEDITSSVERVPKYTELVERRGVAIVDSIDTFLDRVDAVLLLSNDGRPHLRQALPCFAAGKRVFIDKPMAGSLEEVIAIFRAAEYFGVPTFSASSLRYMSTAQAARRGEYGPVIGADTYSHCELEPTHPDLFWYGMHGVEILYTAMGVGCQTVWRATTPDTDVAMGQWIDGRIGTFRGTRTSPHDYGGTVFTPKKTQVIGPYDGYRALGVTIAEFFRSGQVPVEPKETIELFAFMAAADESKKRGGVPVALREVLDQAEAATDHLNFDELLQTGATR